MLAITVALSFGSAVLAQDFETGFNALRAGDYATALKEYKPLAEQGHVAAQLSLGFMYGSAQGVPKDYAEAMMWYNISAANGDILGAKKRDAVAKRMTVADISKAQVMAYECMKRDYKSCGR